MQRKNSNKEKYPVRANVNRIACFAPIECRSARILILGSMPGVRSLAEGQYYAHPQNSFWKIMTAILRIPSAATYEECIEALIDADIALWDVLHSCIRAGSLDANTEAGSVKANNFRAFPRKHTRIEIVAFNGAAAEKCYQRYDRAEGAGIVFPFEAVKVEFLLEAA